jgi:AraC-like DNA-binding protein
MMRDLDLLLRGITVGIMVPLAWGLWRHRRGTVLGVLGPLNALGLGCYLLWAWSGARGWPTEVRIGLAMVTLVEPFLFWWLTHLVFFDRFRLRPWHLGWLFCVLLPGLANLFGRRLLSLPMVEAAMMVVRLTTLLMLLVLLLRLWRGWRGDLVESRRKLRGPLLLGLSLLAVLAIGAALFAADPSQRQDLRLTEAVLFLLLILVLAHRSLHVPADLLASSSLVTRTQEAFGAGPLQEDWGAALAKLRQQMGEAELWREAGLSIGALAERVGVPEYRLRRLINQHLGHRNFTSFLNDHRLPAAAATLADPAHRRLPVLTIALDHGFGSIGPFNRAFRERYDMTPTEYRRRALDMPLA